MNFFLFLRLFSQFFFISLSSFFLLLLLLRFFFSSSSFYSSCLTRRLEKKRRKGLCIRAIIGRADGYKNDFRGRLVSKATPEAIVWIHYCDGFKLMTSFWNHQIQHKFHQTSVKDPIVCCWNQWLQRLWPRCQVIRRPAFPCLYNLHICSVIHSRNQSN